MNEEGTIKELKESGLTYSEIMAYLLVSCGVEKSIDQIRYICNQKETKSKTRVEKLAEDGIEKVLIICDTHVPFDFDLLETVRKHKDEVTTIIIGGDLLDCAEISRFPSCGKVDLVDEMIRAHEVLTAIKQIAPDAELIVIYGNHEARFEKYMALNGGIFERLVSKNIILEVVKGFTDYDDANNRQTRYLPIDGVTVLDDWYMKIHDTIVCHPSSFSGVKLKTATMAAQYFVAQGIEFKNIFVGHTHKQGWTKYLDKWCVETGCMCNEMKYAQSGRLNMTPQDNGYVLAVFCDEELDRNETEIIQL